MEFDATRLVSLPTFSPERRLGRSEMEILETITLVLIVAFVLGEVARRLGFPSVIGQIIGGIVLGLPFLSHIVIGDEVAGIVVSFMSDLGIVFLLFLAGLEIEISKIRETSKDATLVSVFSALLPFAMGFSFIRIVFPQYGFFTALVFGGAMMVTSEGTNVKILLDLNSLNTHLGAIMLAAGAIDDIFEVLFLSIVVVMSQGGKLSNIMRIPLEVGVFIVVAFVASKIITVVLRHLDNNTEDGIEIFTVVLIFVLTFAVVSEALEIGFLIGSILGGFILQMGLNQVRERVREDMIRATKLLTMGFIVPFFFVNVGLNFNLDTLGSNSLLISVTVVIAFLGKILGTMMVRPFTSMKNKQLYYLGWAMNSRGAAELVIALIAIRNGLIPSEIFAAIVAMSIITTLVFPVVLTYGIKRNPGLMDYASKPSVLKPVEEVKQ